MRKIPTLELFQKAKTVLFSGVYRYLFPELCIICDSVRHTDEKWFCSACISKLKENSHSRDACRCGLNRNIRNCSCSVAWDFPFASIISIFDYNEHTQSLIRNIKYSGKRALAADLAGYAPGMSSLSSRFDMIIPVPLHWTRLRKRGYNQAEWFAKGISSITEIPVVSDAVYRVRSTGTQTKLDKSERGDNIRNAFALRKRSEALITGKRVLLVDDVITTGATIAECANVILAAGSESVTVMSIARD
jgi:ComF family protein